MSDHAMLNAVRTAAGPIEQAVAVFMLHPETFAESVAAGYQEPFAGYAAGRGGVLGEVNGVTLSSIFVVFDPATLTFLWEQGIAVRGAAAAADLYWEQTAGFGRRHLGGAAGLERFAELGEKVIANASAGALPLFAGWRAMPLAADSPARALQVMFILRELRGSVHFNALSLVDITPVEAHMLNKGAEYAATFGWAEPFADGIAKKDLYEEAERLTNARMAELFAAALSSDEAEELARLSLAGAAALNASASS